VTIMDIDNSRLAALFYAELSKTFQIRGRWRDCSSQMQGLWEDAVREAIARAASQEGDEQEAAKMLLARLSSATGERPTGFYTVAALLYEELIGRYETGVAFFGLGQPWDARTPRTHQLWADALRRVLARMALSSENPGCAGYCFHVLRESADQPSSPTAIQSSAEAERQPPSPTPQPKRRWWQFWR
jgi:hypothetical protein